MQVEITGILSRFGSVKMDLGSGTLLAQSLFDEFLRIVIQSG